MKRFRLKIMLLLLLTGVAVMATTSPAAAYRYSRQGHFDLGIGAGINVRSPVHFDAQLAGEYFLTNNVGLGLAFDALIRSPHAFILTPFARYHFDIGRWPKFAPYLGGGVGAGVTDNGDGFMDVMLPNLGFKYAFTDQVHLGTDMGLHVLTDFDATEVDFRILFVTLNIRF